MAELDEKWAAMLDEAVTRSKAAGRSDVADYLQLKALNDAVREAGVRWLVDSMIAVATADASLASIISIERVEPHRFYRDGANIVGVQTIIRQGVRCLTLEAGWTRTPGDGFMRRGALAAARIGHFGMPRSNSEIDLLRSPEGVLWFEHAVANGSGLTFDDRRLREHFAVFMGP
ncbi:MAG: hypothetical protein ACR2IH_07195 [Pyrinomonadaceae bacterium]